MKKCVIFDLDGTIICSQMAWFYAARDLCALHGREFNLSVDDVRKITRNSIRPLITEVIGKCDGETVNNFWCIAYRKYFNCLTLAPKLISSLNKYENDVLFVLFSNKDKMHSENIIRRLGIARFFRLVIDVNVVGRKPNTYGFNLICSEFQIERENMLFVGDSITDLIAARHAGVDFLFATWCSGFPSNVACSQYFDCHMVNSSSEFVRFI
ncbi:HAD family hydrolase [Marinivivus vitaminiproducens]|uniref:HAD family hydrolase n=1 Tax=Marinivivus vitaminiproducens TaxID=3035935 RepID=UPI0027A28066|nr:HAD family hydrolase [Geminicoccaceae bacterium SCSIO 64248]